MDCSNCGHEVRGMFCTHCGTRVASPPPSVSSALGQRNDPDSTSVINHRELKEMLARVALEATQPPLPAVQVAAPTATIVAEVVPAKEPAIADEAPSWALPQITFETEQEPSFAPMVTHEPAPIAAEAAAVVATTSTVLPVPQGYPVQVLYEVAPSNNRFFAVPLLGYLAKMVMLLPHFAVLGALGIAVMACQLALWAPVLLKGRYPAWGERLVGGYLRWSVRVQAYFLGLTDQYPPFSLGNNDDTSYPVQVNFEVPSLSGRFWAVPLIGLVAKLVMLLPHVLVLYALGIVVLLLNLVTWVPVLFKGQYPDWGYSLVGGYLRWYTRVNAFLFGLNDQYPPFQLGS